MCTNYKEAPSAPQAHEIFGILHTLNSYFVYDSVVFWACGHLGAWSSGLVVLFVCGPLGLLSFGPVALTDNKRFLFKFDGRCRRAKMLGLKMPGQ